MSRRVRPFRLAFSLQPSRVRRHRQLTQIELERLNRTQASVSATETSSDNLLSTWRTVIESLGGHLDLVAVFEDERIAIPTDLL